MKTLVDRDALIFNPPMLGCVLFLPGFPGGGNKVYDRSPYGSHGTITGATWTRLKSGLWCLTFDGLDDKVEVSDANHLDIADAITDEAWVKLEYYASGTSMKIIFSKEGNYSGGLVEQNVASGSQVHPQYRLIIGSNPQYAHATTDISDSWTHLVGTYDGSYIRLFINGVLSAETTASGTIDPNNEPIHIGGGVTQRYAKGSIAILRKYNRALSAIEIQNLFGQEKHLFGVWQ